MLYKSSNVCFNYICISAYSVLTIGFYKEMPIHNLMIESDIYKSKSSIVSSTLAWKPVWEIG